MRFVLIGLWVLALGVGYGLSMDSPCLLCVPDWKGHWLGTDPLGRDIAVRLLRGWSASIAVGAIAALLSLLLGTFMGLALLRAVPWLETSLQAVIQAIWVVPSLLWASLLSFVGGKNIWTLLLAIGLSTWTETARMVRVAAQRLYAMPFAEAARALGLSSGRIFWKHLLPNLSPILRVQFFQIYATAVAMEAGLGFVGLAPGAPYVSLGGTLFEGLQWITLPQGALQALLAAALLTGTLFALYLYS
ncbi:MAG: ABC transporter permease [Bacteroidia bacterium]|nr:ABC transporter permease [Bacteroidia bacterium]MDW8235637.1 ABC transporter permease [Bacteroidia bacterium]